MEPSCPLGTTRCIPQAKFPQKPYNKSFIDQVCSVKMAGYWPRSFFASLWTSTSSRSINTQKKDLANIQPSWPHTWSITHTYLHHRAVDDGQKAFFDTVVEHSTCKYLGSYLNGKHNRHTTWYLSVKEKKNSVKLLLNLVLILIQQFARIHFYSSPTDKNLT